MKPTVSEINAAFLLPIKSSLVVVSKVANNLFSA